MARFLASLGSLCKGVPPTFFRLFSPQFADHDIGRARILDACHAHNAKRLKFHDFLAIQGLSQLGQHGLDHRADLGLAQPCPGGDPFDQRAFGDCDRRRGHTLYRGRRGGVRCSRGRCFRNRGAGGGGGVGRCFRLDRLVHRGPRRAGGLGGRSLARRAGRRGFRTDGLGASPCASSSSWRPWPCYSCGCSSCVSSPCLCPAPVLPAV